MRAALKVERSAGMTAVEMADALAGSLELVMAAPTAVLWAGGSAAQKARNSAELSVDWMAWT